MNLLRGTQKYPLKNYEWAVLQNRNFKKNVRPHCERVFLSGFSLIIKRKNEKKIIRGGVGDVFANSVLPAALDIKSLVRHSVAATRSSPPQQKLN